MKAFFPLFLVASTAGAFSPTTTLSSSTSTTRTTTKLSVAGGFPRPDRKNNGLDSWSDKPLYQPISSESVPDKQVSWIERRTMKDRMIDPDYTLALGVAMLCPLIIWYHPSYMADGSPSLIGVAGGIFHLLFAALLWVQTRRVRLVFEKDSFEFYNIKGPHLDLEQGAWLEPKPSNYVAGTQNRWTYDSIINYGFFPSLEFPVICYFKETTTPEWKWNRWFAAFDGYGRGQPHFFPGIVNVHQFKDEMEKRGVKRKHIPHYTPAKHNNAQNKQKK